MKYSRPAAVISRTVVRGIVRTSSIMWTNPPTQTSSYQYVSTLFRERREKGARAYGSRRCADTLIPRHDIRLAIRAQHKLYRLPPRHIGITRIIEIARDELRFVREGETRIAAVQEGVLQQRIHEVWRQRVGIAREQVLDGRVARGEEGEIVRVAEQAGGICRGVVVAVDVAVERAEFRIGLQDAEESDTRGRCDERCQPAKIRYS